MRNENYFPDQMVDSENLSLPERVKAKKCKRQLSDVFKSFGRIASILTTVGILVSLTIDQLVNRQDVEVQKSEEGNKYEHSDPETTHLINYLAGRENLTENELLQAVKKIFRDALERFHGMTLPEDFDMYNLEQLDDFMFQNPDLHMPKGEMIKFVREEAYRACPRSEDIYDELWQLEQENGAPRLRINTSYIKFAQSKEGGPMARYNGLTHTIYINAPFVGCELREFVAEMAHANQFSPYSAKRYLKGGQYLLDILRVAINARLDPANFWDEYEKTYEQPGTIEYEAHKQIEPDLMEKIK